MLRNHKEPRGRVGGQSLHRWNLRLMPNISYAGCPVYLEWFWRNSLLKCVLQPKIAKNSLKTLFWGFRVIQGHRCWYPRKARQQCFVMIRSKSVSICNRFHAIWANSGKITIYKAGTPLWCPCSRGISSPSGTKITSLETRDSIGYHTVKISWSSVASFDVLTQYSSVTDIQTDRRTEGRLCRSKDAL